MGKWSKNNLTQKRTSMLNKDLFEMYSFGLIRSL